MQDELDELCESYLYDRFEVKVDFAIEESLPHLLADGLIEHAAGPEDPRLIAVDLQTANTLLKQKWQTCALGVALSLRVHARACPAAGCPRGASSPGAARQGHLGRERTWPRSRVSSACTVTRGQVPTEIVHTSSVLSASFVMQGVQLLGL